MHANDAGVVWDALMTAGRAFGLRPTGLLALDVARIEAGLLLIDVDFFSARKALTTLAALLAVRDGTRSARRSRTRRRSSAAPRSRPSAPAARAGASSDSPIDWTDVEALYEAVGLPPLALATASRVAVPVFAGSRQVGRMTSSTWSPVLKQMIGLATVEAGFSGIGTAVEVEHTVDAVRHRVGATVVPTPFFNPKRKTQTPPYRA